MRTFEEKLAEALRKEREGRGLKNSEITLVRAYQSGRSAESDQKPRTRLSEGDSRTAMSAGRDTLWREDGEQGTAVSSGLPYEDADILITVDAGGIRLLNKATNDYAKLYTTGAIGIYDNSSGEEFTVAPADLATTGSIIPRLTGLYDGGVPVDAYVLRGPTF